MIHTTRTEAEDMEQALQRPDLRLPAAPTGQPPAVGSRRAAQGNSRSTTAMAQPANLSWRAVSPADALPAPLLAASRISLRYVTDRSTVQATQDVSFSVYQGDRFILLGPSGCGKSSLLKAAAGFIRPQSGTFTLNGKAIAGPGPDRVVVFQEFDQLAPWKTVIQNVVFALRASGTLGKHEARDRAEHYLRKVGLERFLHAYPHTLSGGMKQRVAIARALAMEPAVLLMDEPFAALDALTRRKMQEELLQLWEETRVTLMFVTHSIEEALVVGNRILLLSPHPGRVRAELNSHQFTLESAGSDEFQAAVQRIHRLLFDEPSPGPTIEEPT